MAGGSPETSHPRELTEKEMLEDIASGIGTIAHYYGEEIGFEKQFKLRLRGLSVQLLQKDYFGFDHKRAKTSIKIEKRSGGKSRSVELRADDYKTVSVRSFFDGKMHSNRFEIGSGEARGVLEKFQKFIVRFTAFMSAVDSLSRDLGEEIESDYFVG